MQASFSFLKEIDDASGVDDTRGVGSVCFQQRCTDQRHSLLELIRLKVGHSMTHYIDSLTAGWCHCRVAQIDLGDKEDLSKA